MYTGMQELGECQGSLLYPRIINMIFFTDRTYWSTSFFDLIWLRNHIVAPLSEEITYRACMTPLLMQCFPRFVTIFIGPIFFGTGIAFLPSQFCWKSSSYHRTQIKCSSFTFLAHFNHLLENLRAGGDLRASLMIAGKFTLFFILHFVFMNLFGLFRSFSVSLYDSFRSLQYIPFLANWSSHGTRCRSYVL